MPNKWISAIDDQESEWDPAKGIAFLFLLERPYGDLLELFKHAEKSVNQSVIVTSFPSNGIVLMALNNSGEYWIDLALKWMEHPSFNFGPALLETIKELAFTKTRQCIDTRNYTLGSSVKV